MKILNNFIAMALIAPSIILTSSTSAAQLPVGPPNYPISKTVDVADTLFGHIIPDPYRWLEETDNAEVQKWTDEQNLLTRSYLDNLPQRAKIKKRLEIIWNYPRKTIPTKCNNRYFFTKNDGMQNQYALCAIKSLADKPEIVIDPNSWSSDGTDAMNYWIPSKDGDFLAYGRSQKGQERGTMHIRNVVTGQDLPDSIPDTNYPSIAWLKDNSGFYYTRQPAKGTVPPGDENYYEKVYFHKLGDNASGDQLIYERPEIKEIGLGVQLSQNYQYLILTGYYGSSRVNDLHFKDLKTNGDIKPIVTGFDFAYTGDAIDSVFYMQTNENASNFKIMAVDFNNPDKANWKTIIPENQDILQDFSIINHLIVARYMHNAYSVVKIFDLSGNFKQEILLPTLGTVNSITGRWNEDEMFLDFDSFTFPFTIYRYDFNNNELTQYHRNPVKVNPVGYETKQVWYKSKDSTSVSMFIVHKKGLKLDGNNPTLLYGYGGFSSNETPYFSSNTFLWLENGGVYCLPNLRGGGEYGEKWHQAGMLDKKQNVFDDFIAAAEWLITNKYTNPQKLAISGASNGGLLVGAVMVQRPELFKAVICGAPLLDMIRYHKFNIARYWIPEYGSSEDSTQLPFLLAYSPYQNVQKGVAYPAVLFQSGESDWRTHPLHPRKMAAELQAATSSTAPILLDMERKTGHGWGMPLGMQLEKYSDEWAFLFWQLGVSK
jgi:prolyl oligopeptidase